MVTIRCATKHQEHEYHIQRIDEHNIEGVYTLIDHSGSTNSELCYGFRGDKFMLLSSSHARQPFSGTFQMPPNDISANVISLLKVYSVSVLHSVELVEYMNAASSGLTFIKVV